MSIALSVPVAYGIFQVLPWGEFVQIIVDDNIVESIHMPHLVSRCGSSTGDGLG